MTDRIWMDLPLLGGGQWVTKESNPVAWAYHHGSDLGGNLDKARGEWLAERLTVPRDWHRRRGSDEPPCGPAQWRTRDRMEVIDMTAMDDDHLGHAIRFASTKPQHASKLSALVAERDRRRDKT